MYFSNLQHPTTKRAYKKLPARSPLSNPSAGAILEPSDRAKAKAANSYLPFSHRATNTVAKSTAGKSDAARPKKLCLKIGVSKTNKGGRQAKIALPRRVKFQPIQKSNTAKIPIKSKWATKRPDSSNAKTKGI